MVDYSYRNMVEVSKLESNQGIPGFGEHNGFPAWLTLLQNHEHKTQEMLISFNSESDRFRWMEMISPLISNVSTDFIFNLMTSFLKTYSKTMRNYSSSRAILVIAHHYSYNTIFNGTLLFSY